MILKLLVLAPWRLLRNLAIPVRPLMAVVCTVWAALPGHQECHPLPLVPPCPPPPLVHWGGDPSLCQTQNNRPLEFGLPPCCCCPPAVDIVAGHFRLHISSWIWIAQPCSHLEQMWFSSAQHRSPRWQGLSGTLSAAMNIAASLMGGANRRSLWFEQKKTIVSIRFLCSPVLSSGDSAPPPPPPPTPPMGGGEASLGNRSPPGKGGTVTRQGGLDKGGGGCLCSLWGCIACAGCGFAVLVRCLGLHSLFWMRGCTVCVGCRGQATA